VVGYRENEGESFYKSLPANALSDFSAVLDLRREVKTLRMTDLDSIF
jgi:hypothetical protein